VHVECESKNDTGNNRATGTISKSLTQYLSNNRESTKLRNYRNQPYWALHTNCGKC